MRDKILQIIKKHRNTEMGSIALSNMIYALLKDEEKFPAITTDSLLSLFVNEDGERMYKELKYFPFDELIDINKPKHVFIRNL